MFTSYRIAVICLMFAAAVGAAQTNDDAAVVASDDLKIAAIEALMSAPPERSLPIVTKVLKGNASDEMKERALFVLSQIDRPEAQALLVETAQSADRDLRNEAIRMIGIGGDSSALAGLADLYTGGDADTREAVLEAYLIADDGDAIYEIAASARNAEEFEAAVEKLGAMGATQQLRALRTRVDMSEVLIEAYAIAGDTESLTELARDSSEPERQSQAIHGLGIAGGNDTDAILAGIYRGTDSPVVKDAVREAFLISGNDKGVLELFRESNDNAEKRELLETLVIMDSDAVWDVIDATLENGQ
jgi:HEAT repeat protein